MASSSIHVLSSGQGDSSHSDFPYSTGEMEGEVATLPKVRNPRMYKVLLLNDDFTPMDFVVLVLKRFFNKTEDEAIRIMLNVHKTGVGIAGVFSLEIAEMKVMQCNQFARMNQYPLKSSYEEA